MDTSLEHKRHTLAHLLAAAVMKHYPNTKRTIGPAIDNGFYFDFEFEAPISEADFPALEATMRELLPTWTSFERSELSREDAKKEYPGNQYKHELIDEFTEDDSLVSFYKSGDYSDLCRGGHVENPAREIAQDSWKLDRIAGAYWRGDEKNTMLTRIYGLAFHTKEELDAYLVQREEARARDHKKLGRELDLFTFSELVGGGLPLWTPRGTRLRNTLDEFVWELRRAQGYEKVEIPHITKKALYETSGHWEKFASELFKIETREGHEFAMKPMNCPHHTQIFARKPHSYRDMPQRYANTTMVYRDEQSGELSGLSRVRAITQDDAHVFCRQSQVKEEMLRVWNIITTFYGAAGFSLAPRLSLHDPAHMENYLGTPDVWKNAEQALRELVREQGATASEAIGEAAFYGPKIDFLAKDSIGREWQVATIQLDMNLPERFDLTCVNEQGEKERIVMIHAAIMGSIERYLSVLIEHYAGAFPLWLAPTQVQVLPVSEKHHEYAHTVLNELKAAGIRTELSVDESLGKRIRHAKLEKVPYFVVVGDKEVESSTVTVEGRKETLGSMPLQDMISLLTRDIAARTA